MIVFVFDQEWGGPWTAPPGTNPPFAEITVLKSHNMPAIVRLIKKAVAEKKQGKQSIWLMHLCAHGNVGFLDLGTGLRDTHARHLAQLAEWMTPGGPGVHLHGCWVASNADKSHDATRRPGTFERGRLYPEKQRIGRGWNLLFEMSWALKCPVKAGIDVQLGDKDFQFEGPTIEVSPGGTTFDDATWRKDRRVRVQ